MALTLLTNGCTTLGPDYVGPEAPVEEDWIDTGHPKVKIGPAEHSEWWKVFNDPLLNSLIETGYHQNLPLRIAGLRILEARAQLGIAVGNLYPQQQQVRGEAIYNEISENAANTRAGDLSFTDYDVGLDAAWELDFWGRFRRLIESADANLDASVAGYDDILVSLLAEVATTYVRIRTLQQRLAFARENVQLQQRSLEITNVRFRFGETTELDVQQAKAILRNTQALIPDLETQIRQAENALNTLLGLLPGQLEIDDSAVIPSTPPEIAVGIPAELLRRRPDVSLAERQLAAQSARIGVAAADLYPRFTLLGSIGLRASNGTDTTKTGDSGFGNLFEGNSFEFFGGPSLSWNVFNYGRLKNAVRVEDARFQQLVVNYHDTVLNAYREVENAIVGFLRAQEQVNFLTEGAEAGERSLDLSLIQYRDGAVDFVRVLEAQRFLVDQQDALAASRGNVALNLISLYRSLGGGWQIRLGDDFVPAETQAEMRARTDWGQLLPLESPEVQRVREPQGDWRKPDW